MILLGTGDRRATDRELVGGKALSIDSMLRLGLPVPPAFVFPTSLCRRYHDSGRSLPAAVSGDLRQGIAALEGVVGRGFGDPAAPLLVSVRSGAARSMPGMMDTVLNVGMNSEIAAALARQSGEYAFGADTFRRFVEQFREIVGTAPSADPWEQLEAAVATVLDSWHSPRAVAYRRHHGLPDDSGTAVTVQAMVFGNLGDTSGTGVLFSRNPVTGDPEPYGEWLPKGQGDDVVSGRFDPLPVDRLAESMPRVYDDLISAARALERHFGDVQDIEFTVERGKLWLLQARTAKRSARAAEPRAAVVRPRLHSEARVLASGQSACPGMVTGVVVTTADEAEREAEAGKDVILATPTTSPDDLPGMLAARAIVTEIGGITSHAAVVSRELGRPCVVGCGPGALSNLAGCVVTVDGSAGEVLAGELTVSGPVTTAIPR